MALLKEYTLMTKQERKKAIIFFSVVALVFMVGAILTGGSGGSVTYQPYTMIVYEEDENGNRIK